MVKVRLNLIARTKEGTFLLETSLWPSQGMLTPFDQAHVKMKYFFLGIDYRRGLIRCIRSPVCETAPLGLADGQLERAT